jgi:YVTN family beta-propeller protein
VAVGAGSVWATGGRGGRLVRVDPKTNRILATVIDGFEPTGVAVGEGGVWMADADADTVTRVDPRTNRKVGKPIKVGPGPQAVITGDGAVWVANFHGRSVSRIDPATNRVVADIKTGHGPADLALGAGGL